MYLRSVYAHDDDDDDNNCHICYDNGMIRWVNTRIKNTNISHTNRFFDGYVKCICPGRSYFSKECFTKSNADNQNYFQLFNESLNLTLGHITSMLNVSTGWGHGIDGFALLLFLLHFRWICIDQLAINLKQFCKNTHAQPQYSSVHHNKKKTYAQSNAKILP